MTETVSGPAARKGRRVKGLKMRRINTTAGVHPYDQVTWERRDVVMTNWRDGSINFEQHGVEFPEFWSVNAGNIVTTKYFRGAVGTPQREWSLKQLVDRVTDVYTKTGAEHGYFASDEDAEIFDHELKYALVHQIFSFNSPVWFNVGTAASQQVSACFILAVDDTIESILDWYKEEGLIFRGGSGAGVNLSQDPLKQGAAQLRRHRERPGELHARRRRVRRHDQVRRGHPPRGQDGRPRRRSPRHRSTSSRPRRKEENKIRALRDAGFDMDLGGADIISRPVPERQ